MLLQADGIGQAPRVGEPESAMLPGMAAPAPRSAIQALNERLARIVAAAIGSDHDDPAPMQWAYSWANPALFDVAQAIFPGTATAVLFSTVNGIVGVTNGSNAGPGVIGEYLQNTAAAIGLTTNTAATLVSLALTPGDWDLWGTANFLVQPTTSITSLILSLSTVTNTLNFALGNIVNWNMAADVPGTGAAQTQWVGPLRVNISAPTTYFLVGFATFTVSTLQGQGLLMARRRR